MKELLQYDGSCINFISFISTDKCFTDELIKMVSIYYFCRRHFPCSFTTLLV